ncbi:MAG: hypothetical protein II128_02625 [Atopobiaceae bacterium]|nr:hypothetical protein [Atopobiaceae bacterium]
MLSIGGYRITAPAVHASPPLQAEKSKRKQGNGPDEQHSGIFQTPDRLA